MDAELPNCDLLELMSPKSAALPVEAIEIKSITLFTAALVTPAEKTALISLLAAPISYLAEDKSPKSVAFPVEEIVI